MSRNLLQGLGSGGTRLTCLVFSGTRDEASRVMVSSAETRVIFCGSSRAKFILHYLVQCLLYRPDYVMVSHLHLAVVSFWVNQVLAIPYYLFCHGIEMDFALTPLRIQTIYKATRRFTNSVYTATRLCRKYPPLVFEPCLLGIEDYRSEEKVRLPLFVDAGGNPCEVGEKAALIVGRIDSAESYKGHDQLLDRWKEVVTLNPGAQLVIAGEGDDLRRLKAKAIQGGVGSSVLFTGFVDDLTLRELYRVCRFFVMPSRREGFGLVYVEAMAAGKPCIASTVDAGAEIVVHGETGFLVNPDDGDELTQRITQLFTEELTARRLGNNGKKRYELMFRPEQFRERLQALLGKMRRQTDKSEPEVTPGRAAGRSD